MFYQTSPDYGNMIRRPMKEVPLELKAKTSKELEEELKKDLEKEDRGQAIKKPTDGNTK